MKKILLASKNKNKHKEFNAILNQYGYEVINLDSLNDNDEVEETGKTFKENALIKARYYYSKYHVDTISDDSGISLAYFNGYPGIYSARFLNHLNYDEKNDLLVDIYKNINDRRAYYTCAIALIIDGQEYIFEGIWNGEIANERKGTNGFGYDPIFYLNEYQKTSAEISPELKNQISHRAIALKEMVKHFEK